MWHLHFRFFVFLIFIGVTLRYGVCEENLECDQEYPPGSEKTTLSFAETTLKTLIMPMKRIDDILGKKTLFKSLGDMLNKVAPEFRAIFPGTHWCGDGNNAKDESDLGLFEKTDACCRAHDLCCNNIDAGKTKINLKNNGIFTRSNYLCDNDFYTCLTKVNGVISKGIRKTYFNILRPQSFKCICPMDSCTDKSSDCLDHCKTYKWIDNPKAPWL